MDRFIFIGFIKKIKSVMPFLIIFSIYNPDNVFAIAQWNKRFVECTWKSTKQDCVEISVVAYDYNFGPKSEHGYLKSCKFEASANGAHYYQLMDIHTKRQIMSNFSTIYFSNKLNRARIEFKNSCDSWVIIWPDDAPGSNIEVTVRNKEKIAKAIVLWYIVSDNKGLRYIRISGKWAVDPPYPSEHFNDVIYKLELPEKSMLKSNTTSIKTNISKNDTVKVFNDSEAIVIIGADPGANIKVYTTSGVELNSVISNNYLVKIKLPAKQIYIVQIGKSRYKVAL